jgi:hypothetical protein
MGPGKQLLVVNKPELRMPGSQCDRQPLRVRFPFRQSTQLCPPQYSHSHNLTCIKLITFVLDTHHQEEYCRLYFFCCLAA